jgi:hypothetical protein
MPDMIIIDKTFGVMDVDIIFQEQEKKSRKK